MTVSIVGYTSASADSGSSLVLAVPAGIQAGDVLMYGGTHQNQPTVDWTLPSTSGQAFSRLGNPFVANDVDYRGDILASHVVASLGAEPASYTFTFTGTGRITGALVAVRGLDTTALDDGHPASKATISGNDRTMPSFTVGHDGSYLFLIANNQLVAPNAVGATIDSAMTQIALLSSHPGADSTSITRTQLLIAGKVLGAAGASPTPKVTWPAATGASIMAVALRALAGNAAPTASFTHAETGLQTSVNGSASADADGSIASYDWNFGDGSAHGSGSTASHTYSAPGTYTVTLTVTDNGGATGSTSQSVTVAYPTATVKLKTAGGTAPALVWIAGASGTKLPVARVQVVGEGAKTVSAFIGKAGAVMGHMGESWDEVEGSLEGVTRALMAGVDGIMLSLARTSDGKLFVLNDTKYLDQMQRGVKEADGGTTLDSSAMTWAQVSAYDQGSYWTKRATPTPRRPFMLLSEFLTKYPTVGPIMLDPKTIPSTYFGDILDIMDANGGPTRFIAKYFCTGTGWADAAHARNAAYRTWGYFYAAGIADGSTPLSLASGHWDWIGLDNGGASAQWTAALALGKPVGGHIAKTRADYDLGMSKGAQFIMAGGVQEARNLT